MKLKRLKISLKYLPITALGGVIIWLALWFGFNWIFKILGTSSTTCILLSSILLTAIIFVTSFIMTLNDFEDNLKKQQGQVENELKTKYLADAKQMEIDVDGREKQLSIRQQYVNNQIMTSENRIGKQQQELDLEKKKLQDDRRFFDEVIRSELQTYPWLAQQVADYIFIRDCKKASALKSKKHPAITAAEQVKEIAKEKRELQKLCKMYEYQFNYLATLYPWIEDFICADPIEAYETSCAVDCNMEITEDYNNYHKYLSKEEYSKLPPVQKYQLALDRYKAYPKKDNWEAGIAYERYIGYIYEEKGYTVKFNGALMYRDDMGIDLLAKKNNEILIIQCKRYRKERVSHESVVFQLFGTSSLYQIEHPDNSVRAIIYSTSELTETARKCTEVLNIEVFENFQFNKEYPIIKCNVSHDGEKIYHLPFDQQYDRVQMCGKDGALYVNTIAEAEVLGFRRAHKWMPELAKK